MSDSSSSQMFFMGLPGSGKTTFLAALWHVLDDQSSTTSLRLTRLSGDRTYLNRIAEAWRSCSPVERTTLQTEEQVGLHLVGDSLGEFELAVPDLSGEAFELQLTDRRMSIQHDAIVQQAAGIILFLHPDVKKGIQLGHALQLEASISESDPQDEGASEESASALPWSVENMPTQVKLVELLQFVLDRSPRAIRVAVVVSAWDLVENLALSPLDYVSREMPLLRQFLDANRDELEHAVFGVSAQGGSIPDDKSSLLAIDALDRIKVCDGNDTSRDITRPIAWLLGVT